MLTGGSKRSMEVYDTCFAHGADIEILTNKEHL
jgi:hypothetical protein